MRSEFKRGFTLLECIVALALFATAAVMIGQACFNALNTLDLMKKNPDSDALRDWVRTKVMEVQTVDELESGIDIEDIAGAKIRVTGTAEPTAVADLFLVNYTAEGQGAEFSEQFFLIRRNWYENTGDRDELISDRTEYLETLRASKAAAAK